MAAFPYIGDRQTLSRRMTFFQIVHLFMYTYVIQDILEKRNTCIEAPYIYIDDSLSLSLSLTLTYILTYISFVINRHPSHNLSRMF